MDLQSPTSSSGYQAFPDDGYVSDDDGGVIPMDGVTLKDDGDQVIVDVANALGVTQNAAGDIPMKYDSIDHFQRLVCDMGLSAARSHGASCHYCFVTKALPIGVDHNDFPSYFQAGLDAAFDIFPVRSYSVLYVSFTDQSFAQFKRVQKMLRKKQYGRNRPSKTQLNKLIKLLRGNDDLAVQMYATHLTRLGFSPDSIILYTGDKYRDAHDNVRDSPPIMVNGLTMYPSDYPDLPGVLTQVNYSHPTDNVCLIPMDIPKKW